MSSVIREADLRSDRNLIIRFLREHLTAKSDEARYEWLYLKNPAGPAKVWIAWDRAAAKPIGIAVALPRILTVRGLNQLCWVLADFCIAQAHRSLGPAVELQRKCLEAAESNDVFCCIDFPSKSMISIYARLGIHVFSELGRFAKPLKLDRQVSTAIPISTISRPVSAVGNIVLRMAELRIASPPGTLVTQHHSELGEEFVFLAQQLSTSYDCFSRRTAEYLNWRYIRNPLRRHIVLACWQEGELVGYAIVSQEDNGAGSIQEIVCLPQEGLWQWLALTAARFLRKAGSRVAYFWCSPCKSIPAPIRGAGFHLRDFAPVMVYHSGSAGESAKLIPQPTRWLLMNGDRDS